MDIKELKQHKKEMECELGISLATIINTFQELTEPLLIVLMLVLSMC